MKKKLEKKIKFPGKNTLAGIAFAVAGLTCVGTSVYRGFSSYEHFEKATGWEYNYTDDAILNYNPHYNVGIADGAISLIMGTSAISCGCFAKRRFLNKKKKDN